MGGGSVNTLSARIWEGSEDTILTTTVEGFRGHQWARPSLEEEEEM